MTFKKSNIKNKFAENVYTMIKTSYNGNIEEKRRSYDGTGFKRYDYWRGTQHEPGDCTNPSGNWDALPRMPGFTGRVLAEAAMVHGIDAELLVEKINAFLNA